jgi:5'-deoxynucleotidase YfbR-like HD superfamily hydrolase
MSYCNSYTATVSGEMMSADPNGVRRGQVKAEDYLTALGNQCRFNGHVPEFYSVLQHSILVANLARLAGEPAYVQRAALFHDVHEAYCGDIAAPQKGFIDGFDEYEEAWQRAVALQVGVPVPGSSRTLDQSVRIYDLQALAVENTLLRDREDIHPQYTIDSDQADLLHRVCQLTQTQARETFAALDSVLSFYRLCDIGQR